MRFLFVALLALMLAVPAFAKLDVVIDPDYDPRITLRVVVLPALKDRSLRRVNERTISAMFATELLRQYEVLDLLRFEQVLLDNRLSLDKAFSSAARATVRDVAGVDALCSVEIYRWDAGKGGIPLIGRKSGQIGARVRLMDPNTGRIYWSVNRLEKVKPGADFLDRTTQLARDLVTDLGRRFDTIREEYNRFDSYAELQAQRQPWQQLTGYGRRTFNGEDIERGFMPKLTPEAAYLAAYQGYGYQSPKSELDYEAPVSPDVSYEDIETERKPLLPRLDFPPLYGDELKAVVDSVLKWTGVDTTQSRRAINPELPPFEMNESPRDTVRTKK